MPVVLFKDSVDFIPNHICILGVGVADEINTSLGKCYRGGVDLPKSQ